MIFPPVEPPVPSKSAEQIDAASSVETYSKEKVASANVVRRAVQDLNQRALLRDMAVRFSIDESSNKTIIRVIDRDTQKIVRQIPTEEAVSLARHFQEDGAMLVDLIV